MHGARSRVWRQSDTNSTTSQLCILRPAINLSSKKHTLTNNLTRWHDRRYVICKHTLYRWEALNTCHFLSSRCHSYMYLLSKLLCTGTLRCVGARGAHWAPVPAPLPSGTPGRRPSSLPSLPLTTHLQSKTAHVGVITPTSGVFPPTYTYTSPSPTFSLSHPPTISLQVWQFDCTKCGDSSNSTITTIVTTLTGPFQCTRLF